MTVIHFDSHRDFLEAVDVMTSITIDSMNATVMFQNGNVRCKVNLGSVSRVSTVPALKMCATRSTSP